MNDKKLEVDAYVDRMHRIARKYVQEGMSLEAAEEKATNDVRREIRNGPPIGPSR